VNSFTKRIISSVTALTLAAGCASVFGTSLKSDDVKAAGSYNYAEALQKSMFFYEVQQAGVLPEWNEVAWRADSMENDKVPGGWFDAGDHLKFALTNAYSSTLLAWGLVEYGDAVDKAGLGELYRNNLKWGLDYLVESDLGDSIVYMIGEGAFDHVWWGSAEVYMQKYLLKGGKDPRPAYTCQDSCIEAQMACALAAGYIVYKDSDPAAAKTYLEHAKDLFKRADAEKSIGADEEEHPYYKPSSYYDDLFFAANWLYKATNDKTYLDTATSYVPKLDKEQQSEEMKFTWGHCWDDTTQGAMLLYAQNTNDAEWIGQVKKHLEYWTTGYGGKQISKTPDGLSWLFQWGSLRHATTTAFLASLASDTIFKDDAALSKKYNEFAKFTMDYCFGDNDMGMSYVLGMGEKNPKAFHHRTASGIHDDHWNELGTEAAAPTANGEKWQTEYAHTLYGALVGGPNMDGTYTDQVNAYQCTEVAIDYNAGFTAELCALIADFGGTKLADFPVAETPKWDEWQVAAVLNGSGDSYSELKAWAMNHTAWPARVAKNVSFRYYFDASEIIEGGLSIDDVKVETKSQQYSEGEAGYATAAGPFQYKDNIYYAEIKFEDGRAIMPTGQSEHRDEVQFRVSIPDAVDGKSTKGCWDASNDWSFEGVEKATSLKSDDSLNKHIPMYVDDVLVWGIEPDGTEASVTPAVKPSVNPAPASPKPSDKPSDTPSAKPTDKPSDTPSAKPSDNPSDTPSAKPSDNPSDTPSAKPSDNPSNPGSADSSNDKVMLGDVNVDGKVDITDISVLSVALVDKKTLEEKSKKNADVDRDGEAGLTDLSTIKQYVSKVITSFN